MPTIKQLAAEIEDLNLFEDLTKVYSEVALSRMNKVRKDVLSNRQFLESLEEVFVQIQAAYLNKLSASAKKGSTAFGGKVSVLQHNGMKVRVLVSANTRLYGDILRRTFQLFMNDYKKERCEATIIGKVGLTMFKEEMGTAPVTEFDFPDERIDRTFLGKIIEHLVQYESVTVYYPKFKNVVMQEPTTYTISASTPTPNTAIKPLQFHFEPSLEAVMAFFEKEIFATFLEQTLRESQLSKFASRALAMDRSQQSINTRVNQTIAKRRVMIKDRDNKRQLNLMPAYILKKDYDN